MSERKIVTCTYAVVDDTIWENLPSVELVDVTTGEQVKEETKVKIVWDDSAFYVRFECKDDYAVSPYLNHDDPLYEADVVEVFIDEVGDGYHYIELELSPFNVIFDAKIDNDQVNYVVHDDWHGDGIKTTVDFDGDNRIYHLIIPFRNFQKKPETGTKWRINFYRIDEDRSGTRQFQAWSPTFNGNYHEPSHFGELLFVK
jgi:hypothetical protein